YGCKSEIPSSSDNSDQPANQTIYNLTDSHSSDTAVIASPYEVDVNLESETSNLQVGVEPTAEAQASNIQLHFLDPQNTNRFNTTYSDACNSLDTSSSCQITLVPNNNAQLIDNQTVGYYITGNINGSLTRLKPEYFIVKSLTTEPNAFIGSGGQSQLTIYNNTGVDVDLSGYQFKSDDTQLSAQLSEALQTGNNYVLANNKKFIVNVSATDDHTNSRSAVLMVNSTGINAVDSTINVIRPSVNLSPNQLTLWPNQTRTITIENNTPALAKVSDISLSNTDGVSLDTSNCDDGIIGFSSCKVTLTSKKKIATKEVDLIVTGENFDTQQASVYTELPNPSIKPVHVDMTPNQLTLLPNHNNTITISNHSATQSAYIKEIDLPGLTDAEVISNTCGNTISALDSCQISFSVDHNVAKQRAYLSISGKNFLPQESQITTIPTPRAKKATRIEITPSQLTLIPNHTQKLTVKNLTSNKAYLKEIDLPSLSGVLITNNCSDVDYLTSKGSCEIIFHSGKQIGSSSNTVSVYGKNFLSKEAHITAKSPHLPGKPTSIDLIPNQITLLPNQSKSIVINNQSRVATKGLSINIPTLDGVTVTNNTCGDELLGKTSCTIEFKANSDVVSKQSDSLLVTGNNFLSKQAQIDTNNPKIQLKKLTRVEITPNQLVLLPSQTREMTISNMTATTADIKELNIPDLS
ncbi:lamin tail domain-containing protein, partial [Thiotrichales bacterium 19X7-9]|nr:lamin tail domain-containing protein [Thiotrichales bacterium 19X7-9]